ncbi:MAG: GNAT family N-acetyltransferase [Chloroflexia bacterium]|nr:GNAT family N-acetyltransferase [Chloroflexia bacterium]
MTIQVHMHRDPAALADLAEEWTDLLGRSIVNTIFITPPWQQVWWRHFGGEQELWLLLARDEAGTLQGIAPLYALEQDGQRLLQFVGGVAVSDYLDFVVAEGREKAVYRAFLEYLQGPAPPWDVLDLHCLPGDSATRAGALCQACQECCADGYEAQQEDAAPYIPLPGDWEAYLDTLDKKQRHEIRRKLRKAEREARVHWGRVQQADQLTQEVGHFVQLHRASHPEKEAFMDDTMEAFFRDMAEVTFAAGWLSLYTLYLDERPAASMWCFDYGRDLLVYNSGYDPAYRPELSSGIVLMSYCIQEAIQQAKARFDLMRGDEPYKYRFGAVDGAVYHLVMRRADCCPAPDR